MVLNESLQAVVSEVLGHQLGKAIVHIENYLGAYPQPQAAERLESIKNDYLLMTSYWQQGYNDPERESVYDRLLRRLYVLATNLQIRHYVRNSSFVMDVYNRTRNGARRDWTPNALRRDLEGFVSDVAMLQLEAEQKRKTRQEEIYASHQQMMADLFDYIWTSRLWTEGVADAFEKMLLSPTVDSNDQQLLVSAITLSTLNFFGINKFRLLLNVYQSSTDERVRQRALIGWVLCLNVSAASLYSEIQDLVRQTVGDPRCCDELAELQMQMVYCLRTESDKNVIENEIMPELLKNNNIRVTRSGVEEVEDDSMEDVLHPELAEQRMEKLEETVRRMSEMQREGVDVYFSGFSQMKRFPFFRTISNWFVPFYPQHTAVSAILDRVRSRKFLERMLDHSPFCDSDKYSFAIGFEMALSKLPDSIVSMLDRGEASLAGMDDMMTEELQSPAYLRRAYLQNLYRFYRVFPQRAEFVDPFGQETVPRYFFFANPLFRNTPLEERFLQVVTFFMKRKVYDAARLVLQNYSPERCDAQFYLMNANVLMRTGLSENAGLTACESYARLIELEPDNERGWAGYARALFACGEYGQSLSFYRKLIERHPDSKSYQLNAAVCLTNTGDYDEALKMLYKLNYEAPEDNHVNRVLAWALVGSHKYERAIPIYETLVGADSVVADDLLNAAYCQWFSGNVTTAVGLFRRYGKADGVTFDPADAFLNSEAKTLSSHGISEVEAHLMADLLI